MFLCLSYDLCSCVQLLIYVCFMFMCAYCNCICDIKLFFYQFSCLNLAVPFFNKTKIYLNIFIALSEYSNIFVSLKWNEYEYLFETKIFEYSSIQIFVLIPELNLLLLFNLMQLIDCSTAPVHLVYLKFSKINFLHRVIHNN